MKKITAIFVLILGLAIAISTAVNYFSKEKVVDLGDVKITRNKPRHLSFSPLTGIAIMGFGGVMLWTTKKNK